MENSELLTCGKSDATKSPVVAPTTLDLGRNSSEFYFLFFIGSIAKTSADNINSASASRK
ncbi:MAG: hypothetical protein PVF32_11385 [Desulfobacterales bacterium]|jgi:hypothetical protein